MVMTKQERNDLRDRVNELLEEKSLSEILEMFDISEEDAFLCLYESGQLDPETFNELVL